MNETDPQLINAAKALMTAQFHLMNAKSVMHTAINQKWGGLSRMSEGFVGGFVNSYVHEMEEFEFTTRTAQEFLRELYAALEKE